MPLPKKIRKDHYYTYKEYYSWGEGYFCELIDGKVIPRESEWVLHQKIVGSLGNMLHESPYKFYYRIDVRFDPKEDESDGTVVNPDFTAVLDKSSIRDDRAFLGVPAMVIEILSSFTEQLDRCIKLKLYRRVGVKEYWIVDPQNEIVHVCMLQDPDDDPVVYKKTDTLASPTFPGLEIPLAEIFPATN